MLLSIEATNWKLLYSKSVPKNCFICSRELITVFELEEQKCLSLEIFLVQCADKISK